MTTIPVTPENPLLRLMGRMDLNQRPVCLDWTGSGLEVRHRGRHIWAEIAATEAEPVFWMIVLSDGCPVCRFPVEPGVRFYPLILGMEAEKERTVTVPASYAGTAGKLSMTIFGISDADEWTTDVALKALSDDGTVLGQVTITGAPFKRNRVTEYSGNLFGSGGGIDVSLNDTWEQSFTAEW